jgi:hypothetical protein
LPEVEVTNREPRQARSSRLLTPGPMMGKAMEYFGME